MCSRRIYKTLVTMPNDSRVPFLFFGTPHVAAETLRALLDAGFVPHAVITNPDAPKGRGLALAPSPVKELALARNIEVRTPVKLDDATQEAIRAFGAEYAVVVAYGKIFPEALIQAFPKGVLNVHYSLLPRYRGATPTEAALLHGDIETGITVQKMTKELDAGDILVQEKLPIAPNETVLELRPRLISLGSKLLVEALPRFERGELTPIPQDPALATHSGKFKKEDGQIDLGASGIANWNKYRGYLDTIGTHFFTADGTRVKITAAHLDGDRFVIDRVIPEGRREIAYVDLKA